MNIPYVLNWRSVTIALLISLLLHMGMALYIALEKSGFQLPFLQKQEKEELLPQEKKHTKDTEWVETKGRSSYGAPVLFRDEPNDEVMPDFTQTSNSTQAIPDNTLNEQSTDNTQSTEQLENQPEIDKNSQEKAPVKEKLDITSSVTKTINDKQDATSLQAIRQTPISTKTLPARHSERERNNPNSGRFTQTSSGKPITMTKKTPSLAQLTQGVLNYVKDEGQYAVSMIGKKGGVPSDEQMKYERFLQKLSHCLQTSFSINNDRFPQCDPSVSSIEIFLALNKDGTLHNLRLVKTSGDPRVDAFMMFAFRDASSSFPTVPHYLPHNPFSITYVIDISPTRNSMGIYRR